MIILFRLLTLCFCSVHEVIVEALIVDGLIVDGLIRISHSLSHTPIHKRIYTGGQAKPRSLVWRWCEAPPPCMAEAAAKAVTEAEAGDY